MRLANGRRLRREFYRGFRLPSARIAFQLHSLLGRIGLGHDTLAPLRRLVRGRHESSLGLFDLRPGTIDAWILHPGAEEETHDWIERTFHGDGALFDVGAFIGTFSLRHRRRFTHVFAVEASSRNFAVLSRQVELNSASTDITAIHAAATDLDGELSLFLNHDDTHSLLGSGPSEKVRAARLDDLWEAARSPCVALVKIDVEGAEPNVIAGAGKLLASGCHVVAEANDSAALDHLTQSLAAVGFIRRAVLDGRNYVFSPGT